MSSNDTTDIELPKEIKAISEKINTEDFKILQMLGRGTFGKVMLVEHIGTGKLYALKILRKAKIIKLLQVEHTKSERKYLNMHT
jgi:serine/threonine protein kinase